MVFWVLVLGESFEYSSFPGVVGEMDLSKFGNPLLSLRCPKKSGKSLLIAMRKPGNFFLPFLVVSAAVFNGDLPSASSLLKSLKAMVPGIPVPVLSCALGLENARNL